VKQKRKKETTKRTKESHLNYANSSSLRRRRRERNARLKTRSLTSRCSTNRKDEIKDESEGRLLVR